MDFVDQIDSSWDTAVQVVRTVVSPPSALSRLVRLSWGGTIVMKDFITSLNMSRVDPACIIRAAQLIEPEVTELEAAITTLDYRTASAVAAIHFVSQELITRTSSERIWMPITRHMMNSIEIGYHFGVSAAALGPDSGLLIGFAQALGAALLLSIGVKDLAEVRKFLRDGATNNEFLARFECEPCQVASLTLQRLGFGLDLSSAAVMAVGNLNYADSSNDPVVKDWRAASDWIYSLTHGRRTPSRSESAKRFAELVPPEGSSSALPLHLQSLYSQVDAIRELHSTWTWHLPMRSYQETAELLNKAKIS